MSGGPARRGLRWVALVGLLAGLVAGCDVEPFCLGCPDAATADAGDAGEPGPDAGRPDAQPTDGGTDAEPGDAGCAADELCNGLDDDCDGTVDEGFDLRRDPRHCGGCERRCAPRHAIGECVDGECGLASCDVGHLDLDGDPDNGCEYRCTPTAEEETACDLRDDDCDGVVDEGFDLASDTSNCGRCGRVCGIAHGTAACRDGDCVVDECEPGFYDRDGDPDNGCEVSCRAAVPPVEICNGRDDDCDGTVDEDLSPPSDLCTPRGVCAGTVPTCPGRGGFRCDYPATYEVEETRCDGLDNDCDGVADEPFPGLGDDCSEGFGACRTVGTMVCDAAGTGIECSAPPPTVRPTDEVCDGIDNDCDGLVDERRADDPATPWRDGIDADAIPTVTVPRPGGGTVRIMQYEACRPDATATSAGTVGTFACARPGVMPWTLVTWAQARAACCGLNPDGACPSGDDPGWRLCDAEDWQAACEGPAGECLWSYSPDCTTSSDDACNGDEYDCDMDTPGDQDCLLPTGSATFPGCSTDWGAAGSVYDLSGNAKEWTSAEVEPGVYQVRGGAYLTIEAGRRCDFDFAVGTADFSHPDTGFRCCLY